MKRDKLALQLAREAHLPAAAARDEVDILVHKILKSLRQGKPVKFPGIGKLVSPPVKRVFPPVGRIPPPAKRVQE